MEEKPIDPKLSKEELFKANPERWICMDDLIIGLMRTDKGPAMYCSPIGRREAILAMGECHIALTKRILENDVLAEAEREGKIVPAKGGIINSARRNLFRR